MIVSVMKLVAHLRLSEIVRTEKEATRNATAAERAMTAAEGQVKLESVNKQLEGKVFFANCCEHAGSASLSSGRQPLPLVHARLAVGSAHV